MLHRHSTAVLTLALAANSACHHNLCLQGGSKLAVIAGLGLQAQGADLVIALTHSRRPNDIICARELQGVDIILGGACA